MADPDKSQRPAPLGQFLAGDGVRGIGMVSVLMAHLAPGALVMAGLYQAGVHAPNLRNGFGTLLGTLMSAFQFAVPMFFVMSGYLIARPWVRAYVSDRRPPRLGAYLLNRALRILPVFYVVGTIGLLIFQPGRGSTPDLVSIYSFGQIYHHSNTAELGLGQAWTIDIEVAFYLSVPICGWLFTWATRGVLSLTGGTLSAGRRIAIVVATVAAATVASAWLRGATIGVPGWNFSPPATFYYFGPGIAVAALELAATGVEARRRLRRAPLIFGLLAGLITIVLADAESTDLYAIVRSRGALLVALGSGLALAALIARQLSRGDSPVWVDNRVTRWLGQRSFPCYVAQSATISAGALWLGAISNQWLALLLFTGVVIPLTLLVGAVVHPILEQPLIDWGHRKTRRRPSARPEPAPHVDHSAAQPSLAPVSPGRS